MRNPSSPPLRCFSAFLRRGLFLRSVVRGLIFLMSAFSFCAENALAAGAAAASVGEEERDYPLGPMSGSFRIADGVAYARISKLHAEGYGFASGLREGDYILGAFGKLFPPHGFLPDGVKRGMHIGVISELGYAIDRAEGADGKLPLMVMRPGVGRLDLVVTLPATGAFGPTFPIASPKFEGTYQKSIDYIHERVMQGDTNWYFRGWFLLALLGHPDWDKTTGTRPYRLSINKLRDAIVEEFRSCGYAPTESVFYDGKTNPNHTGGISNWALGIQVSGLASYYSQARAQDDQATRERVRSALQRGIEVSANAIQWWKQPSLTGAGGYSPESEDIAGMVSHGGVEGDYMHLGWGGGINACGTTVFMGFSFGRRAGMDMQVRPMDGHYFGLTKQAFQNALNTQGSGLYRIRVVPPGKETFDHSVAEKFDMQWKLLAYRNAGYSKPGDLHDAHVCYQFEGWNPSEAVGKTAATIAGMEMYAAEGGMLTDEDRSRLERMKLFISRNYFMQMDAHAYCVGAQSSHLLGLAFCNSRQQRFALDNWRFYYALARDHTGAPQYMPARKINDNYLNYAHCIALNFALPGSVLKGGLNGFVPGLDRTSLLVRFDNPDLRWPDIEARYLESNSLRVPMPVAVLNGGGEILSPSAFSSEWKLVSGPGTLTVGSSELNFSNDGRYRVELTVRSGTASLVEPIDIIVRTLPVPAGYLAGKARYERYTNLPGTQVSDLPGAPKFPDQPDEVTYVTRAAGYYDSSSDFGSRLSGLFIPPVTGTYRFYVSADESATLRINPRGFIAAEGAIAASLDSPSGRGNFTAKSTQATQIYQLTAGEPVSFEALQKEGGWADDYLEVAFSLNGGPITILDGAHLAAPESRVNEALRILTQPQSVSANLGGSVVLTFTTNNPPNVLYQWRRNGVPVGTPKAVTTLELSNLSGGAEGWYDCMCTTPEGSRITQAARVLVLDLGTPGTGGLWRDVYLNIGGETVADLTASPRFPSQPDSSGAISSAYTGSYGDNYGQRWTGWVTPPQTGNYRFFRTSDDDAEIWLGTTDQPSSAVRILGGVGYTGGEREWSSKPPSAFIPLVGGQKYYFEVRHKEAGGGDSCAVAWQREGQPLPINGSGEIAGQYLSYRRGGFVSDIPSTNVAPVFGQETYTLDATLAGSVYSGKSLAGLATDANTRDTLTYSKVSGPAWLAVASNGALSGTPQTTNLGVNRFLIRVSDPAGRTDDAELIIPVSALNSAPYFTASSIAKPAVMAGIPIRGMSLAGDARDPDAGDVLVFAKVSGPSWMRVEPGGALTGTPGTSDVGLNSFVVRVTDALGLSASATLNMTVDSGVFYLDLNGTAPGSGAGGGAVWGIWGGWTTSETGQALTFPWLDGASAIFSAGNDVVGNYSVTLDGSRQVKAMTFRSGIPALSAGRLVLDATSSTLSVLTSQASINSPISGSGTLEKRGPGTLIITGENDYAGGTVIQEGAVVFERETPWWENGNAKAPGSGPITVNSGAIVKNGAPISVTGNSQTSRLLFVNGGTIDFSSGDEYLFKLQMTGGLVFSSAILRVADPAGSGIITTKAAAQSAVLQTRIESRSAGLTFDVSRGAAGVDLVCAGDVLGDGAVSKTGAGILEFSGANTYRGQTNIRAGTFLLTGSIVNSSLQVAAGASLTGTGVVNNAVVVSGTLSPGNNGRGVLSFRSNVDLRGRTVFKISKDGDTLDSDFVECSKTISAGGSLAVTHTGESLYFGDVFNLFSARPTGSFASVSLPVLPEYLKWETIDNYQTIRVTNSRPRSPQTIAPFDMIAVQQYIPGSSLTVNFSTPRASSNLPVTVTVKSGPAVLSGNTLAISASGVVVLAANQKGDATFDSAPEVNLSIPVSGYGQSILFGDLAPYQSGDTVKTLSATASSGLPVIFESSDPSVARILGNRLTILSRGTATITASQPGNLFYAAAANVVRTLVVEKNATIAVEDSAAAVSGFPETLNVLANDLSGNGALTVQSVTSAAHGTVAWNNASVTYTGHPGFAGADSFTYTVADAAGATSTATVSVSVYAPIYWTNRAGGSWPTPSNWFQNMVPAGADAMANFRQLDLTSSPTVTLDGARTVGGLLFADVNPSHDWTLAAGANGSLTLDVSNGRPSLHVVNRLVTITAPLSGNDGLQKDGAGELVLTGANTISGITVVNAGKLAAGTTFRGSITVNPGAIFESRQGFSGDIPSIAVVGGTFIANGGWGNWPLSLELTGGSLNGSSRLDLGPGSGRFSRITSLPSPTKSVIDSSHPEGILVRSDSGQSEVAFQVGAGSTPDGIDLELRSNLIQLWYFPQHGVVKQGPGTMDIRSANAYWSGPTTINEGTLVVSNYLPADSTVTVGPKGALAGTGRVDGDVTVSGRLLPGYRGIGTLEFRKTLTLAGRAEFEIRKNGSSAMSDTIAGATRITAGGALFVTATGDDLVEGDVFTLFNIQPTGSFATVNLPTLPSYLSWQTSDNYKTIRITGNANRTPQTIGAFGSVPPVSFVPGASNTLTVTAPTASSGLPVKLTVKSGPATLSGNVLSFSSAGTVVLAANQAGNATYLAAPEVTASITVTRALQTLSFAALPAMKSGKLTLNALASSGLPVTFSSSNPAVATVSGSILTVVAPGVTRITAMQAGDSVFEAASIDQFFTVNASNTVANPDSFTKLSSEAFSLDVLGNDLCASGSLSITSLTQPSKGFVSVVDGLIRYLPTPGYAGTDSFTYTVTDGAGLRSTATVSVILYMVREERWSGQSVYTNQSWNAVAPNFTGFLDTFTTAQGVGDDYSRRLYGRIVAPVTGNYTFWLAQDDDSRLYLSSDSTPEKKALIATRSGWSNFEAWDDGNGKSSVVPLQAGQVYYMEVQHREGGGGDHASVAWQPPGQARQRIAGFTPIVGNLSVNNPSFNDAALPAEFKVTGAAGQLVTLELTNDRSERVSVETFTGTLWSSYGTGASVALDSAGQLRVRTASSVGSVPFYHLTTRGMDGRSASGRASSSVNPELAPQTISAFATIAPQTYAPGKTVGVMKPASSSGLPVALAVKSGPATLSGSTLTLTGVGTVILSANQSGNLDYLPAPEVITSIPVTQSPQNLVFTLPASVASGAAPFALSGSSSSGLTVSYMSSNPAVATVLNGSLMVVAPGVARITATQAGNTEYMAASPVERLLTVRAAATQALPDSSQTFTGTPTVIPVLANDVSANGTLSVTVASAPIQGRVVLNGGELVYTSSGSFSGTETFSYSVTDLSGGTASASVTVTVINPYDSLAAWWRLDEGSGTVALDSGGANRSASHWGSPAWVNGRFGKALSFNGSSSYLSAPGSNVPGDFTVSAWINPASIGSGSRTIFGQQGAFRLAVNGPNLRFTIPAQGDYDGALGLIAANSWQHVAVTYARATRELKFFHNGVLRTTLTVGTPDQNSNPWTLGQMVGWGEFFHGILDDVRLHTRLLPTAEIGRFANVDPVGDSPLTVDNPVPSSADSHVIFTVSGAAGQGAVLSLSDALGTPRPMETSSFGEGGVWTAYSLGRSVKLDASGRLQVRSVNAGASYTLRVSNLSGASVTGVSTGSQPKASQTLSAFAPIADRPYEPGVGFVVVPPVASSGLPVALSVKWGAANITNNTVTPTGIGPVVLAANQAGNETISAAPEVTTSFTVGKRTQAIRFDPLAPYASGPREILLAAVASSNLPVTFRSSNPAVAEISGSKLLVKGPGTSTITALQMGSEEFSEAVSVERLFSVTSLAALAVNDQASTPTGFPVTVDVTQNDRAGTGSLKITHVSTAANGTVRFAGERVNYLPNPGFTGEDWFEYTVTDDGGSSAMARVDVSVGSAVTPKGVLLSETGFEEQNTGAWQVIKPSGAITLGPTISSTNPLAGTYSLSMANGDTNNIKCPVVMESGETLVVDFLFRIDSPGSNFGSLNLRLNPPGTKELVQVRTNTSNRLQVYHDTNGWLDVGTGASLLTGKMYRLQLALKNQGTALAAYDIAVFDGATSVVSGSNLTTWTVNNINANTVGSVEFRRFATNRGTYTIDNIFLWRGARDPQSNLTITGQPLSQSVSQGGTVTFSVNQSSASETAVTYQWRKNGIDIPSATNSSFSLPSVQEADAGFYSAVVSDGFRSESSAAAALIVNLPHGSAAQTISAFGPISPPAYSVGASFPVTRPTATSGLPVALRIQSGPAMLAGDNVVLTGAGTVVLAATQPGDATFAAADEVVTSFSVSKATQTIDFPPLTSVSAGGGAVRLEAFATSGLAVTYTSSNPAVATIFNDAILPLGAGTATITAAQAGDGNWQAATAITRDLVVSRGENRLTPFAPIDSKVYPGTAPFAVVTPTASSNLAVTVRVKSGPAILSGGSIQLTGVGTVVLAATQPGNASFLAADEIETAFVVEAGLGKMLYVAPSGSSGARDAAGFGGTPQAPFASAAYAASQAVPGDTIALLPGIYTNPTFGEKDIWKEEETIRIDGLQGTAEKPITIRALTPGSVLLKGDGTRIFQLRSSSHIVLRDLIIEGEVQNIPLEEAKQYQFAYKDDSGAVRYRIDPTLNLSDAQIGLLTNLPRLDFAQRPSRYTTDGLLVQACSNIQVADCVIRYMPGTGLRFQGCDLFKAIGNTVHDCARRSAVGNHGFTIHSATSQADGNNGYRIEVLGNRIYDNYNEVYSWSELKSFITPVIDEGKGFTIQKSSVADGNWLNGRILVANNVAWGNGFSGLHVNQADRIDVVNNTVYNNTRSGRGVNTGISVEGDDIRVLNNVAVSINGFGGNAIAAANATNLQIQKNLVVGSLNAAAASALQNSVSLPESSLWTVFENAEEADLRLKNASPAIGQALAAYAPSTDLTGRNRDSTPDLGAYEFVPFSDPPIITTQPSDALANIGEHIRFEAAVSGGEPLTYHWFQDGNRVEGADGPTLIRGPVQVSDAGRYQLRVENAHGVIQSRLATLTVRHPATITVQPNGAAKMVGSLLELQVGVSGSSPITYEWKKGGVSLGVSTPSLSLPNLTLGDSGAYSVTVSNVFGSVTSVPAIVVVTDPPRIVTQPVSQTAVAGRPITISVQAEGSGPFSYRWFKNGIELGVTAARLMLSRVNAEDEGNYIVQISNQFGAVSSDSAALAVVEPVAITIQPVGGTISGQGTVPLSVTASGTAPLSYQWSKDSTVLLGATDSTFLANSAGTYTVVVTNAAGSVISAPAVVSAAPGAPVIALQPSGKNLAEGESITLSVLATGVAPLSYQWMKDGLPLQGATKSSLVAQSAGAYAVSISNSAGVVTSATAVVRIPLAFSSVAALYQGLLVPDSSTRAIDTSGAITASVNYRGAISGKIQRRSGTTSFVGKIGTHGQIAFGQASTPSIPIVSGSVSIGSLSLEIISSSAGRRLTGKLIPNADDLPQNSATLSAFPIRYASNEQAGSYTALFQKAEDQAVTYPDGDGHAFMTVYRSNILLSGKLADGSRVSSSLRLSENGSAPLFVPLYGGKGFLTGDIRFDSSQIKTDATGFGMRWFKSGGASSPSNYTAGWPTGIFVDFIASRYDRRKGLGTLLPSGTSLKFFAAGGDLQTEVAGIAQLLGPPFFTVQQPSAINLQINWMPATGSISGSFMPQGTTAPVFFSGSVLQKSAHASGFFLRNNQSGVIQLTP